MYTKLLLLNFVFFGNFKKSSSFQGLRSKILMEIPQRILAHATSLFMRLGIRSVTMDDIAGDLGISKKTIYQYFSNKAQMVEAVANAYLEGEKAHFEQNTVESSDAIDEILRILYWSIDTFDSISPNLILETQKFYPRAWQHFEQFQKKYLLGKIRQNLEWGISEGLYRKNLHVELVSQIRLIQINYLLDPQVFPQENFKQKDLQMVSVDLYLHSILSPKGLVLYQQRINLPKSNNNLSNS